MDIYQINDVILDMGYQSIEAIEINDNTVTFENMFSGGFTNVTVNNISDIDEDFVYSVFDIFGI